MATLNNAEQTVTKQEAISDDLMRKTIEIKQFRWCQLLSFKENGFSHIIDVDGHILPITEDDALAYQDLFVYDDKNNPLPAVNMSHQQVDAFLDGFAESLYITSGLDGCLLDEDGYMEDIPEGAGVDYIRSCFKQWYEDGHMPVYTIEDYLFNHVIK
jgi:hypothetical protein